MTAHHRTQVGVAVEDRPDTGRAKRINVAVTPETVSALRFIIDHEGIGLAEAVRRLVAYGEVVYTAVRVRDGEVFVQDDAGLREVVLR